ncbi:PQQ-binding-like beta-propeller repeat protein [Salinirarus marinus]|uniref:outer membrane protein assembly factor BamB family protein n=1 Tax=Salinirarus marinus TaxID=3068310 RepID=UPI003C6BE6B1
MTDVLTDERRCSLGELDPAGSRHNWARSAVTVADDAVFAGGPGGRVTAHRPDATPIEGWSATGDTSTHDPAASPGSYVVSLAERDGVLVAGERGPDGYVSALSSATGERRWRYATAEDVGTATKESLLFQPYVVDVAVAGGTTVAAARRYERDGEARDWSSAVLGFGPDGDVRWRYRAHASPIALDVDDGRVAVAYNRCTEQHVHGLVVLDADSGDPVANWDPGTEGDRRVGDVAFADDGIAIASHGDKHGYLLDADGGERWRVDLASEQSVDGETVYAYPNHVRVAAGTPVFVTGNTYAESTRDPDARHPREHTAVAVDGGDVAWTHDVGGFARGVSANGSLVAVPSAQNFRERTADTHAVHLFDARRGHLDSQSVPGIASAAALGDDALAVVEEPVEYHDEGVTRGAYRLHAWQVDGDAR